MKGSSSPISSKYAQRQILLSDSELDPLSVVLVEDMLQGLHDWRNMPDIVRLTLKTLTNVVKNQGEAIRDLERQNISNVKLVNLQQYLESKANVDDVKESLSEIVQIVENRPTFDDINTRLEKYGLKDDVDYILQSKVSVSEFQSLLESKVSVKQLNSEMNNFLLRVDDLSEEIKQFRHQSSSDIITITNELALKANLDDMNSQIDLKANKQSVASALQRKCNKIEVDALLARKADTTDIQNLLSMVDNKVDNQNFDRLSQILETKLDRTEFTYVVNSLSTKADINDLDVIIGNDQEKFHTSFKNVQSQLQMVQNDSDSFKELYEKDLTQTKNQIEDFRFNLSSALSKKADGKDLDKLYNIVSSKIDAQTFAKNTTDLREEIWRELQELKEQSMNFRKQNEEMGEQRMRKSEQLFENIREEVQRCQTNIKNVNDERKSELEEQNKQHKQMTSNFKKEIQREMNQLLSDLDALKKDTVQSLLLKAEKNDFLEFKVKVFHSLDEKTDLMEVQNALNACQSDVSQRFIEFKQELQNSIQDNQTAILDILDKKANVLDLQQGLALKADNASLLNLLSNKVNSSEIEEMRKLLERLLRECEGKVSQKEFDQFSGNSTTQLEDLHCDMILKANIKDVCSLLDAKTSTRYPCFITKIQHVYLGIIKDIDDVNRALGDIHKELEKKSFQEDLNNIVNDQSIINEQLCTENIVARWTWKSGEVKMGSLVPWDIQLVNTLPDNFLWEKEKTSILVVAPGLYEITLGFFAKKKPTIQLLINGEPILSAVNTASYVMHHSSGKIKDIKHSAGIITGLTLVDFVILPARARLSLTYTGEFGGEGFFGLKRL